MEALKAWWIRNEIFDWVRTTAVTIVMLTLTYGLLWVIHFIFSSLVDITGLDWLFRGVIVFSFAVVVHLLWSEYREYKKDPENYPHIPTDSR